MKKYTLISAIICLTLSMQSQELVEHETNYAGKSTEEIEEMKRKSEIKTLFGGQNSFGGYLSMSIGVSELDGSAAFNSGGRAMLIVNNYLGMGFGGKAVVGSPEEIDFVNVADPSLKYYENLSCGYGGFYIEPIIFSNEPVHVSFPILLGGGGASKMRWSSNNIDDFDFDSDDAYNKISSVFFIAEPGIDIEMNIAKWFRMGIGASYRITSDIKGLTDSGDSRNMNGLNCQMTFKFGWF